MGGIYIRQYREKKNYVPSVKFGRDIVMYGRDTYEKEVKKKMKGNIKQISRSNAGEFKVVFMTTDVEAEQLRLDEIEVSQRKYRQEKLTYPEGTE